MNSQARVALVTGGGQGIGKAISQRFLRDGLCVVLAEIDAEAGAETAQELGAFGEVLFQPTDVADEDSVQRAVAAARARWGRLDVLVNNAYHPVGAPITELTLADWNRALAVNLTGAFLCAKHAVPALRAARGAIVNIASTRALMSEPHTEAYSASKGGLLALTHALAISLGPEIRVNCISPGWIDTTGWKKRRLRQPAALSAADHAQHPAGRVGVPADIAALAAFLAGPESGFITGHNFVADGGMTRKMIYV